MSFQYIYFSALSNDEEEKKSNFIANLKPLFNLAKILGVLPVSGLNKLQYNWISIANIVNILAIIFAAVLTFYNFNGLFGTSKLGPDQAIDIFLHLSSPIFYLSSFLTSVSCLQVGRKLPHIAAKYDQATSRLIKYSTTKPKKLRHYAIWLVVSIIYIANISHYFGRLVVNGCLPFADKRLDFKAVMKIHLKGCVPYIEPLTGSNTFGTIFAFACSMWINLLWNLRDTIIISFSLELRHYFKILADYLQFIDKNKLDWKTIREDHRQLCQLVTLTDDAISILIFQSYASNVYHICLDFYNALHPERYAIISSTFRLFTLGYFLTRTILVTLAADSFHQMAQKPMGCLLGCPSRQYTAERDYRLNKVMITDTSSSSDGNQITTRYNDRFECRIHLTRKPINEHTPVFTTFQNLLLTSQICLNFHFISRIQSLI
ncbi:Gr1p [Chamberlinius hualienensis]